MHTLSYTTMPVLAALPIVTCIPYHIQQCLSWRHYLSWHAYLIIYNNACLGGITYRDMHTLSYTTMPVLAALPIVTCIPYHIQQCLSWRHYLSWHAYLIIYNNACLGGITYRDMHTLSYTTMPVLAALPIVTCIPYHIQQCLSWRHYLSWHAYLIIYNNACLGGITYRDMHTLSYTTMPVLAALPIVTSQYVVFLS